MKRLGTGIGMTSILALTLLSVQSLQIRASAAVVAGCGTNISTSTTLTADVGPCSGDGVVVTASNITLDLGGHRVFGTGAQVQQVGIRLQNVSGVTVRHGSVDGFAAGVLVLHGAGNTVTGLDSHDNNSTTFVADNPDAEFGDGILILGSSNNLVQGNRVRHNGPFSGISVVTEDVQLGPPVPVTGSTLADVITGPIPRGNLILNNVLADNNVPLVCPSSGFTPGGTTNGGVGPCTPGDPVFGEDIAIRLEGPSTTNNVVSGNTIMNSGRDGISVENTNNPDNAPSSDNEISHNRVLANGYQTTVFDAVFNSRLGGDGIFLRCFPFFSVLSGCPTRITIQRNQVLNNASDGIATGRSTSNAVIGNVAEGNPGISPALQGYQPYDGRDGNPTCDNNTWLDNTFGTVFRGCERGHLGWGAPPGASLGSATAAATSQAAAVSQEGPPQARANPFQGGRHLTF